jgi:hypothetical protein
MVWQTILTKNFIKKRKFLYEVWWIGNNWCLPENNIWFGYKN